MSNASEPKRELSPVQPVAKSTNRQSSGSRVSANPAAQPCKAVTPTGRVAPVMPPRLIRFRDAPRYLGMDRNRFNNEVRPHLTVVPIGIQGIAFDRLELDAWVDEYLARNGRPGRAKGVQSWDAKNCPASNNGLGSGTSTNTSDDGVFAKALEVIASKKRNASSRD